MSSWRNRSKEPTRHVSNPYPDYAVFLAAQRSKDSNASEVEYRSSSDHKQLCGELRTWLKEAVQLIEVKWPPDCPVSPSSDPNKRSSNHTLYTGVAGNAYLHWRLSQWWGADANEEKSMEHLLKALQAIETALSLIKTTTDKSFYCGAAGVHTLAAVLYQCYKEPVKVERHLRAVLSLLSTRDEVDEILYGRAGFLSCLLILKKNLPPELCKEANLEVAMRNVFDAILASGQSKGKQYLQYFFYGTEYLGAAHGVAGILFTLLQFPNWCLEPSVSPWIKNTIDVLIKMQFKSGNFPSSSEERYRDLLVHWCHGAPGMTSLLLQAYKVFNDDRYSVAFDSALGCVWRCGLLKKGYNLCHGMAGNGYCFLLAYCTTNKDEHFYQAMKMGQSLFNEAIRTEVSTYADPQRFKVGIADHPYSLMEGLAGTICFVCDLLHPELTAFPGYAGDF